MLRVALRNAAVRNAAYQPARGLASKPPPKKRAPATSPPPPPQQHLEDWDQVDGDWDAVASLGADQELEDEDGDEPDRRRNRRRWSPFARRSAAP